MARNFFSVQNRSSVKILEVGCGTGANIWFISRKVLDTYGIDGSQTAITKASQRMREENLSASLQVGDIISMGTFYPNLQFDAIIDVVCLQHNTLQNIQTILAEVLTLLKPQGKFFSMMVAKGSYGDGLGRETEPGTFVDINEGPLNNRGLVHFFTEEEIERLFGVFDNVQVEYSIRSLNNQQNYYKHWIIEGAKSL